MTFGQRKKASSCRLPKRDDTGLWLAGIVAGILLAMVSVALSRVPTLTAVLMAALSVAAAFVQPDILLLFAAGISILLLSWQKHKNAVSAASFLLVGVIVAGVAAISLQTGTMQSLSENAKNALHYWRYEKAGEVLPEGNLSEPVTKSRKHRYDSVCHGGYGADALSARLRR